MNYSSQNEYYIRDSKITSEGLNQKKLKSQLSLAKSPLKDKRKFINESEGAIKNSYQIQLNNFVNQARVAPQPMFKTTVQKHGVIKHVERIHSETQKYHQNLSNKRSERNIFYNKLISASTKRSYQKIKQNYCKTNDKTNCISRAEITYLQNSYIDAKPTVADTSLQINHHQNILIRKNKYQIISYAKKEEKYNILNQTENQMNDDDRSEKHVLPFKSKRKL
ncbi:unnamed protein product [Paramecium octaurelia]|uniref:Uncharacterized protein n=1 Tax=Paramecium octaurelia TaxID=43137 RepID=A0A8S1UW62_PAROT|nr:unnamed protein product [Paramecium octaurelia]